MQGHTSGKSPTHESVDKSHTTPRRLRGDGVMGEVRKKRKHQPQPETTPATNLDELDRAIGELNHSINTSSYKLLVLIQEFDERLGWLSSGARNCTDWLQWRCDLGPVAAREKVRVANALPELPCISDAFASGELSYTKVRALTRLATAENESELVALAKRLTATNLEQYCRQRKHASAESSSKAKKSNDRRACSSWCNHNTGTMVINLELPVEEGQLFEKALEKAMQSLDKSDNTPDDKTTWRALRADAAVTLAKSYLNPVGQNTSEASRTSSTADHYQVMIHVDESALTRGEGLSDLPIDTVKRLCCDGSLVGILENEAGEPLSVGRKQRSVSTAIYRALLARDRGCSFPGCTAKRYLDAHHLVHWVDGGETSVDNCCLLCSTHHKLMHEGGYSASRTKTGGLQFERGDGFVVPSSGYSATNRQEVGVEEESGFYGACGNVVDLFPRKHKGDPHPGRQTQVLDISKSLVNQECPTALTY